MSEWKRIKSIDLFRGLCIAWMICGHLSEWWMYKSLFGYLNTPGRSIFTIIDFLGAAGLLFISGVSITISYRRKQILRNSDQAFNFKKYRAEYIEESLRKTKIRLMGAEKEIQLLCSFLLGVS